MYKFRPTLLSPSGISPTLRVFLPREPSALVDLCVCARRGYGPSEAKRGAGPEGESVCLVKRQESFAEVGFQRLLCGVKLDVGLPWLGLLSFVPVTPLGTVVLHCHFPLPCSQGRLGTPPCRLALSPRLPLSKGKAGFALRPSTAQAQSLVFFSHIN